MKTIRLYRSLPRCTGEFVYVLSKDRIYQNHNGEWVEKRYFTGPEVRRMTGIGERELRRIIIRHRRGEKIRVTLAAVKEILRYQAHKSKLKQSIASVHAERGLP